MCPHGCKPLSHPLGGVLFNWKKDMEVFMFCFDKQIGLICHSVLAAVVWPLQHRADLIWGLSICLTERPSVFLTFSRCFVSKKKRKNCSTFQSLKLFMYYIGNIWFVCSSTFCPQICELCISRLHLLIYWNKDEA